MNKLVKGVAKGAMTGAASIAKKLDPASAVRQSKMPKGRITPGYKMPIRQMPPKAKFMPMPKNPPLRMIVPKRGVRAKSDMGAMSWKNKNYKPSNGIGVGN